MIAAILTWLKAYRWALELLAIGGVAFGVWYWQHERYEAGIHQQRLVDAAERTKLIADADARTAALQIQASAAEQSYVKEHQAAMDYISSHPLQSVRLCLAAGSASHLPKASAAHPGDANAGTGTRPVQPMPSGDPSVRSDAGPDISSLLNILAQRGDDVSAVLREYQSR